MNTIDESRSSSTAGINEIEQDVALDTNTVGNCGDNTNNVAMSTAAEEEEESRNTNTPPPPHSDVEPVVSISINGADNSATVSPSLSPHHTPKNLRRHLDCESIEMEDDGSDDENGDAGERAPDLRFNEEDDNRLGIIAAHLADDSLVEVSTITQLLLVVSCS